MDAKIEHFYFDKEEPIKSCILALRDLILESDELISEGIKYNQPFFLYKNKNFAYIWFEKKSGDPYLGITKGAKIDHPILVKGNRNTIKIIPINPKKDLPIKEITEVFELAKDFF
ncbi:MAG: DUF1801 domain-containing protein [Flavobacteriales bacterium]|nr:DUF1801 domain-containing protein [Flavobacteriales bacterium]